MESDSCKTGYEEQKKEHRDIVPDDGDIPEPIRLRRAICMDNGAYRRLLDYNIYLLCVGGAILLAILLFA